MMPNRRQFLQLTGAGLVSLSLSSLRCSMKARPNILFIGVDDMTTDLGCYGSAIVKTPHMDRLASEGVRFEKAYCQVAVCNGSRTSLFTSLYPNKTGVYSNKDDWHPRIPESHLTLPEYLKKYGYETIKIGKMMHGRKEFRPVLDPPRKERMWDQTIGAKFTKPKLPARRPKAIIEGKVDTNSHEAKSLQWGPTGLKPLEQMDGLKTIEVDRILKQRHEKPFFLAVSIKATHLAFHAPDEFYKMYSPEKIPLPNYPSDDLKDVPHAYESYNTFDGKVTTDDEKRDMIASYYACISYVDFCVGRIMASLKKSGHDQDTVVCLWSDHGYHLGEHGLWRKFTLFEEALRVPLIIWAPGVIRAGRVYRYPVEFVDLYPTLAELGGLPAPENLDGVSLLSVLKDPQAEIKPAAFSWSRKGNISARTMRWRYSEWGGPDKAELYDHETDPKEIHNVVNDLKYAKIRERHHKMIREIRRT